jgi:hypothetical protein
MITSIIYIIVLFYLFNKVDLINTIDLVKDYCKLLIFALIPMIFRVASLYNKIEIKQIVKEIVKFSIIPLFIINEYTFNIFLELLIILIVTLLSLLIAVSETNPKYNQVKKFFNWCLAIIGLYIIIFAFMIFLNNIDDLQQTIFWKKMFLELLLLCHIPLLILVHKNGYFEQILIPLKIRSRLGLSLKGRVLIFLILLKNCHFNRSKLEQALKKVKMNKINSYSGLEVLLKSN